jgi:predicted dehydrogenase
VCTTDNLHATVSAAAMKKRKHVFCQKPLTHTIYEARRIAEIAKETGVATQIAVANQASESTRLLCEWIWDGAIGPVREVKNWSSRPFWPQGIERPKEAEAVPEGLDWNGHSTTPTCLLCGGDGATSVAALWETWGHTVLTQSFAS